MNIQNELIHLLQENNGNPKEILLSEKTDLIKDLQMDSVAVMQLIVDVEEYFQISFNDVDLLAENFSELGNFCRLIGKALLAKEKQDVI